MYLIIFIVITLISCISTLILAIKYSAAKKRIKSLNIEIKEIENKNTILFKKIRTIKFECDNLKTGIHNLRKANSDRNPVYLAEKITDNTGTYVTVARISRVDSTPIRSVIKIFDDNDMDFNISEACDLRDILNRR